MNYFSNRVLTYFSDSSHFTLRVARGVGMKCPMSDVVVVLDMHRISSCHSLKSTRRGSNPFKSRKLQEISTPRHWTFSKTRMPIEVIVQNQTNRNQSA